MAKPTPEQLRAFLDKKLTFIRQEGRDVNYVCPICEQKQRGRHTLHVRYDTHKSEWGVAVCHSCGYRTLDLRFLIRSVMGYMPKSLQRTLSRIDLSQDVEKIFTSRSASDLRKVSLPPSFTPLTEKPHDAAGRKVLKYVLGRGMSLADIVKHNVGYCTERDDSGAWGYAVFPLYMNGRVVYWQGRNVFAGEARPKTWNPVDTQRDAIVYGADYAAGGKRIVVVEGLLDKHAIGDEGVAVLSKFLSPAKIRTLLMLDADEYVVCFDSDARKETLRAARELHKAAPGRVGMLRLNDGDPDDRKADMPRLLRECVKWIGKDIPAEPPRPARHKRFRWHVPVSCEAAVERLLTKDKA